MPILDLLILISLCLGFSNIIYYLVFAFVELPKRNDPHSLGREGVSIIICARNEYDNLRKNLSSWLNQTGVIFELIIVNDGSTDGSGSWLDEQAASYDHLRVFHMSEEDKKTPGKKQALTKGVREAKFPHLLLTDADCRPGHSDWARHMSTGLNQESNMVLGFSPLTPDKSIVSKLAACESIHTAMQYGSYGAIGRPYMGVGRNMAYTRSLFEEVGGFRAHSDIISGDDDLFVQQALSIHANISLCMHPHALTYSTAPATLKDYLSQKSRHISTSTKYSWLSKLLLGWFALSHVLFFVVLLAGVLTGMYAFVGVVLVIRLVLVGLAWRRWMKILLPGMNWMYYVCFDFWLVVYYIVMVRSLLRPSKKW